MNPKPDSTSQGLEHLEQLRAQSRERLRGLWVDDVEHLLGLLASVGEESFEQLLGDGAENPDDLRHTGARLLGEAAVSCLLKPAPGGQTGCRVAPESEAQYLATGRVRPRRLRSPASLGRDLPPVVRLSARLPAVRDQGQRGTCVAFAATALREFLAGGGVVLSEQFQYYTCKELDGTNDAGTYLSTAMSALARFGLCRGATWPYNPLPIEGNEGQGPPPPSAAGEAAEFLLPDTRTVEPQLPDHIREMLAGDAVTPGMPVVVGTLVFNSWFMSPATHRTGRITLPLPGERPVGGHAWCIVGYVDDDTVPGGGYFIARNSWGTRWAHTSREGPGHALIPYAYIERCALEAFTGPTRLPSAERLPSVNIPADVSDPAFETLARPLSREARDVNEALHPAGTRVLMDPLDPGLFLPDGPAQRKAFLLRDCTWSDATRQRLWFPPVGAPDSTLPQAVLRLREVKIKAGGALDANLRSCPGAPFPPVRHPRWLDWLVPYEWVPKIRQVTRIADLTPRLVEFLKLDAGVPTTLTWPADWHELLQSLNSLQLFEVQGSGRSARVLVGFIQRLRLRRAGRTDGSPESALPPLDNEFVTALTSRFQSWCDADPALHHAGPLFMGLAMASDLRPDLTWQRHQGIWTVVTRRLAPAPVDAYSPPAPLCQVPDEAHRFRPSLPEGRDFLDRLKPESDEERATCVRGWVDFVNEVEGGNASVAKIAHKTGYRRSVVLRAFFGLQRDRDYRVRELPDRTLQRDERVVLTRARPGEGISITAELFSPSWLRRHALRIGAVALGVGVNHLAVYLQSRLGSGGWVGTTGFILALLIMYLGSQLQARINRRADRERD